MFRYLTITLLLLAGSATAAPLLRLDPEHQNQSFGGAAAWLGDVNGDGHDDFLIIDGDQRGTGYSGRAYVYFGGPGVDAQADLVLQQDASGPLRNVLIGPFDFNGDGYGDIVLSAPFYDLDGMTNCGAVFVYHGGPGLDAVADRVLPGPWTNYLFGTSLANAGHFDLEDEYDDLAVTIATGGGWGPPPTAYVYRGGPVPSTDYYWLRSELSFDFAHYLATAGDRNGDGRGDLVFGLPSREGLWIHDGILTMTEGAGAAYLVHGGELRLGAQTYWDILAGPAYIGSDVDGGFDINGDGLDDVIATAPGIQETRLILGHPNPATLTALNLAPGQDAAGLGDVNGDGFDDLAIVGLDNVIYVFWGGATPDAQPDWSINPEPGIPDPYIRVWRAGDVNADGRADVLVTLMWYTGYGYHAERAYVYSGAGMTSDVPSASAGDLALVYGGAAPNPFNPQTEISFSLDREATVHVRLFDVRGRLVCTAFDGVLAAGDHTVTWNGLDDAGRALPSGTYMVQVLGLGRAVGGVVTMVK